MVVGDFLPRNSVTPENDHTLQALFPQWYPLKLPRYYNEPEGKNCHEKILVSTFVPTWAGVLYSIVDINLLRPVYGELNIMMRLAQNCYPFAFAGMTYGASACFITNARGHDDVWNNAFASACAGSAVGLCYRSYFHGYVSGGIIAALTMYKKYLIMNNYDITEKPQIQLFGRMFPRKHNHSIMPDPKDENGPPYFYRW